jgi:hypothetical protein
VVVDQWAFCRGALVPRECEDSVVVAHDSDLWGGRVGFECLSQAEMVQHEVQDVDYKSVEGPDVRVYWADDSCWRTYQWNLVRNGVCCSLWDDFHGASVDRPHGGLRNSGEL